MVLLKMSWFGNESLETVLAEVATFSYHQTSGHQHYSYSYSYSYSLTLLVKYLLFLCTAALVPKALFWSHWSVEASDRLLWIVLARSQQSPPD